MRKPSARRKAKPKSARLAAALAKSCPSPKKQARPYYYNPSHD